VLGGVSVLALYATGERDVADLAPYVAQSGLRGGVVLGAVLLVVPFAVFAVQVLRLGSAARERRLGALSLHGATAADLRRIAATEGGRPGMYGGLLAGPVYLALWVLLGALPPPGYRMLPDPGPVVLVSWLVLVPALTLSAAVTAAGVVRAASVDPLGRSRRAVRPLSRAARVVPVVLVVLVAADAGGLLTRDQGSGALVACLMLLLIALALASGPWLVVLAGRVDVRRRGIASLIAGRRLLADPRTLGRVAGVLLAIGLATGIAVGGLGTLLDDFVLRPEQYGEDLLFYVGGYLAALAGIGFALVVASLSLVVGAGEQILDSRRPTAVLVALGASTDDVRQVLRRQLTAAAVAPGTAGAALGWVLWTVLANGLGESSLWFSLAALPAAVLVAGAAAVLGATLAARLLRTALAEAASVESLRAA